MFFFFKQKTAYEIYQCDWSSDVCSSDLWAIYGLNGKWDVENHGIAPDIKVWQNPKLVREGHDPQLEKAVEVLMKKLKAHPAPHYKRPAYPNYHPVLPPPGS